MNPQQRYMLSLTRKDLLNRRMNEESGSNNPLLRENNTFSVHIYFPRLLIPSYNSPLLQPLSLL